MKPAPGVPPRKQARLDAALERCGSLLVAFSGGKDSFYLARRAAAVLGGEKVVVCHARTQFTGAQAAERVRRLGGRLGLPLRVLRLDLLAEPGLRDNPRKRCYLCKRIMFTALQKEARRRGIAAVADGTTRTDQDAHRPGRRALEELGALSPLRDAGITSEEIAAELKGEGIPPLLVESSTCLATRFPYGERLLRPRMLVLDRVERFLAKRGVHPARARYIPDGTRIEAESRHWRALVAMKEELLAFCRRQGLLFVALDLGGLQSGPWDKKS